MFVARYVKVIILQFVLAGGVKKEIVLFVFKVLEL